MFLLRTSPPAALHITHLGTHEYHSSGLPISIRSGAHPSVSVELCPAAHLLPPHYPPPLPPPPHYPPPTNLPPRLPPLTRLQPDEEDRTVCFVCSGLCRRPAPLLLTQATGSGTSLAERLATLLPLRLHCSVADGVCTGCRQLIEQADMHHTQLKVGDSTAWGRGGGIYRPEKA